jgi:hypothetical protein
MTLSFSAIRRGLDVGVVDAQRVIAGRPYVLPAFAPTSLIRARTAIHTACDLSALSTAKCRREISASTPPPMLYTVVALAALRHARA